MYPYKMKLMQQLEPGDYEKCKIFLVTLLFMVCENCFNVRKIMFGDKAHFDLHGNVNKQNVRYYTETNPNIIQEKPLHSLLVMVWCNVSGHIIIERYFSEDDQGANVTVTSGGTSLC